jgi:hypothetical protein
MAAQIAALNSFQNSPSAPGARPACKTGWHVEQTTEAAKPCDILCQLVEPRLDVRAMMSVVLPHGAQLIALADE